MAKKKILIVNVNWIGDVLFSTPFIRAVREAYPDSYIACLLHPRCREMLDSNIRLDDIILYDEEGEHKGIAGKIKLILKLRKIRFDTAFLLHRSFTKALIVYLAGVRERIGYPTKNRGRLLTITADEPDEEMHKVEYFLNLARSYGIEAKSRSYEFFIGEKERQFAKEFLKGNGVSDADTLVMICPGGNWDPKRWPKENFAKVSDMLAEKHRAKILIAGAQKDVQLAEAIRKMMHAPAVIACGHTTLKELGALMEKASLVIANDTGPMHLAVAMKTKVLALFGPTSAKLTGPYGEGDYRVIQSDTDCDVPCYDMACTDNRCMAAIKPDDVFRAASEMLTKR